MALAQGTVFTYQGRLNDNGTPYTGNVEFQPTLWTAASSGSQVAVNSPAQVVVGVTNGLFVLPLDFGAAFPGVDRWLQLEVRTVIGPFAMLSPRQKLTPAPYAITASQLTGSLSASQLSGTLPSALLSGTYSSAVTFNNESNSFTGDGAGLTSLSASQLAIGTVPDVRLGSSVARTNQVWLRAGNAGTVAGTDLLGTTDTQPLEFKVNNQRALRIEISGAGPANLIGGAAASLFAPGTIGGFIGGGNGNSSGGNYSAIVGGAGGYIAVGSDYGSIGGGVGNSIDGNSGFSSIGGGHQNTVGASSGSSVIGGGTNNSVTSDSLAVVIGGGQQNAVGSNAIWSVIGGGLLNSIAAGVESGIIAGGRNNTIGTNAYRSTIGGGYGNTVGADSIYASIVGGLFNDIGMNAGYSTIGGGYDHSIRANSMYATIAGGNLNGIGTNAGSSAVGGGYGNNIWDNSTYATIAGGYFNDIGTNADYSAIAGGYNNNILDNGQYATIPGGRANNATNYAFAAGYNARATNQGAFVWSDSTGTATGSTNNNSVTMRASGGYRFFTGTGSSGAQLLAGQTSWSVLSDRNLKKDIQPADSQLILDKLCRVPMSQWHYEWETESAPLNLGPMAQDFKAAFFPGRDDKSISTLEYDGVALAAIQGLNRKVEEQKAALAAKEQTISSLEQRLADLEKLVQALRPTTHSK